MKSGGKGERGREGEGREERVKEGEREGGKEGGRIRGGREGRGREWREGGGNGEKGEEEKKIILEITQSCRTEKKGCKINTCILFLT